jgi:hypothetical protein
LLDQINELKEGIIVVDTETDSVLQRTI